MIRNSSQAFSAGWPTAAGSTGQPDRPCTTECVGVDPCFLSELRSTLRRGLNYLHTTRVSPSTNTDGPSWQLESREFLSYRRTADFPLSESTDLPTLGSNAFLPSDEVSSTIQVTDDFTKIYGKHTFKMGFEYQHVKFSTLQPPWSRGQFDFDGTYTDVPNVGGWQHRPCAVLAGSDCRAEWRDDRLCRRLPRTMSSPPTSR